MYKNSLRITDVLFHRRTIALLMLGIFWLAAILPLGVLAQQPSVTVLEVKGMILVNDQEAAEGAVLMSNDQLGTPADSTVMLKLSDGSQFEIGEQTKLEIVEMLPSGSDARISRLKLIQGWFRVKSSQNKQAEGTAFEIETSDAVIGVEFPKPDIEVSYDPQLREMVGIAHTVTLYAKNTSTAEEQQVPKGSTVLIGAESIQIVAGIDRSKSSDTSSSGLFDVLTDTKTLVIVGGIFAVQGISVAVSDDDVKDEDFIGNFEYTGIAPNGDATNAIFSLIDISSSKLDGTYHFTQSGADCNYAYERTVRGEVLGSTASLVVDPVTYTENCQSGTATVTLPAEVQTCTLENEKKVLRCKGTDGIVTEYNRQ